MAPNLARIAAPTAGEAGRLNPMRAPKAPALAPYKPPKAPGGGAGGGGAGAPLHSMFDTFKVNDPFNPANINGLAQSGYNADVANANHLAGMSQTPNAQIASDFAQRGAAANSVYQALQQQLAGVQTAQVAQGDAGSAALGTQNAAIGAAPGVLPTAGAQAVLGANTAATGNYGGSLQAAALSAGAQANARALDAGTVAQQANDQSKSKVLQSLLSGIALPSARVDTMRHENQQVDAGNKQVLLSLYQGDRQAEATAAALGDKKAEAAASRQTQIDLAKLTQRNENFRTNETTTAANTRSNNSIDAANTRAANSDTTKRDLAAQKRQFDAAQGKLKRGVQLTIAEKRLVAARARAKGGIKNYYVTALLPATSVVDPNTGKLTQKPATRKVLHVSSKVWDAFNTSGPAGQRKLSVLGVPEGTKIQASTGY